MFYNQSTNSLINQLTIPPIHQSSNSLINLQQRARKYNKNMQNKAKLKNDQMSVTALLIRRYNNILTFFRPKNKAKQSQFKPNFSPKLALFFKNEPNFKPNYVKIGNLRGKKLTRNADFFDEPQGKFRAVREETFERLDLADIGPAVFVCFHSRTAGIIIKFAVNIVKRILSTAARPVRINRAQIIFQEAAGAIV